MAKLHLTLLFCALAWAGATATYGDDLAEEFRRPPDSARPWVYCFWLEGNVTREGITADLEAMRRAGIGGLLFMDGNMGNPAGPHRFMSESWRAMFKHMVSEADRLGLEINLNNDPGWAGSGGPWVTPEQAAQKVVTSETILQGPVHFDAVLAQPPTARNFYRDIVVLACPAPAAGADGKFRRIENFNSTKSFAGGQDFAGVVPWPRSIPTNPQWPLVPGPQCVASAKVRNLTGRMDPHGRLKWDVPAGRWLVLRIGHTLAGGTTRSSQPEATGLECDKLSKSAIEAHFSAMVGKLLADVGPLAGKTVVSTHVDSWEAGSGNWTAGFRDEFRRRRGYDLLPYLPTLNGLVVDSLEVSERFLWDFRETICEMLLENYAGHLKELAHRKGLRLSIEGYDGTCDDLRFIGRADEPMCEFWQRGCYTGLPLCDIVDEVASAAHVYGRRIVGAEAFTSWRGDFLDHPATLKPLGDWAFCAGVNRYCFSEWIVQPWPERVPGVSFLFIGTVFHRSLDLVGAVEAVARVCRPLPTHASAGAARGRCLFRGARGRAVSFCGAHSHGRLRRDPRSARIQLRRLPPGTGAPRHEGSGRMRRVALRDALSSAGPAQLQRRWPAGDARRRQLRLHGRPVAEGPDHDSPVARTDQGTRRGRGHRAGDAAAEVAEPGRLPGVRPGIDAVGRRAVGQERRKRRKRRTPRRQGTRDLGSHAGENPGRHERAAGLLLRFIAARASCAIRTAAPTTAWNSTSWPIRSTAWCRDCAISARPPGARSCGGRKPGGRERLAVYERTQGVTRVPLRLEPHESVFVVFRPGQETLDPVVSVTRDGKNVFSDTPVPAKIVVQKASYGVLGDAGRTRDVTAKVQAIVDGGERRFAAWRLGEGDDPALQMLKTLSVDYTVDGHPGKAAVSDGETICLGDVIDPQPTVAVQTTADGNVLLEAWQNGQYELKTASGQTLRCKVDGIPAARPIEGPWEVRFPAKAGAPESITLDKLISWSRHADSGVKYFSGTATYRKTFHLPPEALAAGRAVYLDLGKVAVIAAGERQRQGLGHPVECAFPRRGHRSPAGRR